MAIVVAIAGAGDIVQNGLRHILASAPDLEVMDGTPGSDAGPDVVVYDAVGLLGDGGAELCRLVASKGPPVVVIGRDLRPGLAARALANGAVGCVSIEAPGEEIQAMMRTAATGGPLATEPGGSRPRLGQEAHLTPREVVILSGITRGLSNSEIAQLHQLSPNTIKSHVRSAYRKMGVATRAQAVSWCLRHGFEPAGEPTAVRQQQPR